MTVWLITVLVYLKNYINTTCILLYIDIGVCDILRKCACLKILIFRFSSYFIPAYQARWPPKNIRKTLFSYVMPPPQKKNLPSPDRKFGLATGLLQMKTCKWKNHLVRDGLLQTAFYEHSGRMKSNAIERKMDLAAG